MFGVRRITATGLLVAVAGMLLIAGPAMATGFALLPNVLFWLGTAPGTLIPSCLMIVGCAVASPMNTIHPPLEALAFYILCLVLNKFAILLPPAGQSFVALGVLAWVLAYVSMFFRKEGWNTISFLTIPRDIASYKGGRHRALRA